MIAFLPVYAGVALLLPGSPALRAAALVLAVLLALVDSRAFIALSRRLAQRYRAEDRENARKARGHEHEREQYERTYGRR
jgi:membrane protein implicated in regulation of membrane protease activity